MHGPAGPGPAAHGAGCAVLAGTRTGRAVRQAIVALPAGCGEARIQGQGHGLIFPPPHPMITRMASDKHVV